VEAQLSHLRDTSSSNRDGQRNAYEPVTSLDAQPAENQAINAGSNAHVDDQRLAQPWLAMDLTGSAFR
jgi:hypothetical protein